MEVKDDNYIGGMVGQNNGIIKNCSTNVNIYSNIAATAGGIAGENSENGQIIKCSNLGNINIKQLSNYNSASVGGIVGANDFIVDRCNNLGNITCIKSTIGSGVSNSAIGGIAGFCWSNKSFVTNCYNKGTIKGDRLVGGIVGVGGASSTNTTGTNIHNSYSVGKIICEDKLKGNIIALNETQGKVENCYYQKNGIAGINTNKGNSSFSAVEMTESQMKNQEFMKKLNLKDTAYLWDSNINDGYPYIDIEAPIVKINYKKNEENTSVTVILEINEKVKKISGFKLSENKNQLVRT